MRYIGSKNKLLNQIEKIITENTTGKEETFLDIFSGTGCVSKHFKKKYKIMSNDLMFYSYCLLKGEVENNKIPSFEGLSEIENVIDYLNNLIPHYDETYFITNNYTPKITDRMYFSIENGEKIDVIRQQIEIWAAQNKITENEYFYLLASLIEAVPFISNITGTFGAYLKTFDKRALNKIELKDILLKDNKKKNEVYNQNANELIKNISGDILYIDPPYTSIDYGSAYHVLETIAKYDNPSIKGITGQRENKNKSMYTRKKEALLALSDLIENAKFKYIVISYSNHGIISEEDIINMIHKNKKKGSYYVFQKIEYRKFININTPKNNELFEFVVFFEKEVL